MQVERKASERAVSFKFLKEFVQQVPKEYSTADVVFKIVVPSTADKLCCYTKILPEEYVSKPNYFVSHRWGCPFHFIVGRIQSFMDRNPSLREEDTFFWVDIFAILQHPGEQQQSDLSQLADAISLSTKTLLCMDDTGLILTRIWCLYEIWKTIELKGDASQLLIMMESLDPDQVTDIFFKFHVEKAQATVEVDRLQILADIEKSFGAQKMTVTVKKALLESSLAEVAALEGAKPEILVPSLQNCAMLHCIAVKYAVAEEKARKALDLSEGLGKEHPLRVNSLNILALALRNLGKFAEAEPLDRESLALRRKHLGDDHLLVSNSLNSLGILLNCQGKYEESEQMNREALTLRKRHLGDEHPHVGDSLSNLATSLRNLERFFDAQLLYQDALAIRVKLLGEEHPRVADTMSNLATCLRRQNKLEEAVALYQKAMEIRKKMLGHEHPSVVDSLSNIATILRNQEKNAEAEALYREALEIRRKALGPEHPKVADSLSNIAIVLKAQGKVDEAEQALQEALAIRKKVLGDDHPSVARSQTNLSKMAPKQETKPEPKPEPKQPTTAQTMVGWMMGLDLATKSASKDTPQPTPSSASTNVPQNATQPKPKETKISMTNPPKPIVKKSNSVRLTSR